MKIRWWFVYLGRTSRSTWVICSFTNCIISYNNISYNLYVHFRCVDKTYHENKLTSNELICIDQCSKKVCISLYVSRGNSSTALINLIIVYELTWNCGRTYDETSSTRRHDKGWEFMKIGKEFEKIWGSQNEWFFWNCYLFIICVKS